MRIKLDLLLDFREVGVCAVDLLSREFKGSVYQKGTAMYTTVTIQCTDGGRTIVKRVSSGAPFIKETHFLEDCFQKHLSSVPLSLPWILYAAP